MTIPSALNGCCSVFGEIEEQSQTLSAKGDIARFADKEEDTKVVAKLVERLQEAIVCYQVHKDYTLASSITDMEEQVSQQQSIYHQVANLTVRVLGFSRPFTLTVGPFVQSSLDTLLKLREVMRFSKPIVIFADTLTEIPCGEEEAARCYGAAESDVGGRRRRQRAL